MITHRSDGGCAEPLGSRGLRRRLDRLGRDLLLHGRALEGASLLEAGGEGVRVGLNKIWLCLDAEVN